MLLQEMDRLAAERADFAFETTPSGLTYIRRLKTWRRTGAIADELMKPKAPAKAPPQGFAAGVGRALRRAAKDARKTARMHETAVYMLKNGKIVADKP